MQTVTVTMNAGDLKKVIDLPNFRDDQSVKVTVKDDTSFQNISEQDFDELIKDIKNFWENRKKSEEKNIYEICMERLIKKISACITAEKNLAIMENIEQIIGDDKGWKNEEEMIKDLAEMRRRRIANENIA